MDVPHNGQKVFWFSSLRFSFEIFKSNMNLSLGLNLMIDAEPFYESYMDGFRMKILRTFRVGHYGKNRKSPVRFRQPQPQTQSWFIQPCPALYIIIPFLYLMERSRFNQSAKLPFQWSGKSLNRYPIKIAQCGWFHNVMGFRRFWIYRGFKTISV